MRLLRPHHWLKNLLVAVPLATAHQFTPGAVLRTLLAFAAFSICASCVYVLNDMIDVEADRAHPLKKARPFASGALSAAEAGLIRPLLIGPKARVEAAARELGADISAYPIVDVALGDAYFRSFYALFGAEGALLSLKQRTDRAVLGVEQAGFIPHVSLLYGTVEAGRMRSRCIWRQTGRR